MTPTVDRQPFLLERIDRHRDQSGIGMAVLRGCCVVVTRALVAKRAVDDDEIRRLSGRSDLARRRDAHQQLAAAGEQFFGNQDGERRADGAADDPDRLTGQREGVERGVIAGPIRKRLRLTGLPQPAHDIAVGVQDAERRHIDRRQALLPPRFPQECRGLENRRRRWVFVVAERHGSGR